VSDDTVSYCVLAKSYYTDNAFGISLTRRLLNKPAG